MTSSVSDPAASASLPTAMRGGRADPFACKHGQSWTPPSSQPPCLAWTTFEHHGRMKVGEVAALVRGRLCCLLCVCVTSSTLLCPAHGGSSPSRPGKLPGEVGEGLLQPNHVGPYHDAPHSTASIPICQAGMMAGLASEGFGGTHRRAQSQEALMKVPLISAVTVALTDNIYCLDLHSFFVKLASLSQQPVCNPSFLFLHQNWPIYLAPLTTITECASNLIRLISISWI